VIFTTFLENLLRLTLSDFINNQLSFEKYSFTFDEIADAYSDKSETALVSDLKYAAEKGNILSLRHHFYLIIPPCYSKIGKLPIELYIHKLYKFLEREYYVGLYSAARFHGAAHQQIQKEYVINNGRPLLDISRKNISIDFITTQKWPQANLTTRKSDAGVFNISSPALTAADLLYHQSKIGGINRTLSVIEELSEVITKEDITKLLVWYPHKSVLQRLGFMLEEVEEQSENTEILYEHLKQLKIYPTLLSLRTKEKPGAVNNRWKVDVNIKMENDI
jgi:predicted transcriptional regulator of viral defense system